MGKLILALDGQSISRSLLWYLMRAKLSIYRFDPESNEEPRYDTYEIDVDAGDTVLSALIKIYENFNSSLSFRFACGKVKCGECSIMVNKFPCLACNKTIEPEMIIEPLPNLPIIKDLVFDRNKVINTIFELSLPIAQSRDAIDGSITLDSEINDTYVRQTTCLECLICQSMCPIIKKKPDQFIGPLGLLWLSQESLIGTEKTKEIGDMVQMCSLCGECWKRCPSEINFLEDAITGLLNKLHINNKQKQ
jgi:succinate dehydrogenase/fumarate reductase iron-sulfur protein